MTRYGRDPEEWLDVYDDADGYTRTQEKMVSRLDRARELAGVD